MNILGIAAFYHDSAAALIQDGKILAAAQEERFTRKKHDAGFPSNAIKFCLEFSGLNLKELDAIAFYDKPLLKFERLLETYYAFAPKGIKSFLISIPVWLREKIFLKRLIHEELKKIGDYDKKIIKLLFPEHHLSHAASAFYTSPYDDAAILTIDGVGEWATASICYGKGKDIKVVKELRFPHSLGLLYSAFTYFLGFKVNSGEYKLMGLAPYGNPESYRVKKYLTFIKDKLIDIKVDGSLWLNQEYFSYSTGLKMIDGNKWEKLFCFPVRKSEDKLEPHHCDLGLAIQMVTEEIVFKMAEEAKKITSSQNLCMAGGVALNCVANGKLLRKNIFKNIFIQPASGDAGGALGSAWAAYYIYFNKDRVSAGETDEMSGSYLGPVSSAKEVGLIAKKYNAVFHHFPDFDDLSDKVASLLSEGNVIGWQQGRMEFGPRALGARSILGDARNDQMQKRLNLKIKYRESFRPFAPSVLAEDVENFFELSTISPYMLFVADVKRERRKSLPDDYYELPLTDRLYVKRSDVQSITHVDFSARIQTVHQKTNERYWKLINKFKEKTGYGIIINTSFNVRGEPIVCTAEDSYRCFMRTEMDYLVINDYLFSKQEQPAWTETPDEWKKEFILD